MTLLFSIFALLLGPVIYEIGRKYELARRIFNAVIIITIALIIGVHIIPEAMQHGGPQTIAIVLLGLAFPVALERLFRRATDTAHMVIVAIAAAGLIIHAIVDGVALLPRTGASLAHAVILHRIPVGMAIWWAARPHYGLGVTAGLFAGVIIATTIGFLAGEPVIAMAETRTIAFLQAFVAGSLIHVVLFGGKHKHH